MEGKDGRTERATGKKRSKERVKGNLCVSQEVISMVVLLLGLLVLHAAGPMMWAKLGSFMGAALRFEVLKGNWTAEAASQWFVSGCLFIGGILAPVFLAVMVGTVVANVAQTGPFFETDPLKWKFSSLNPVSGIRNLFSIQSVVGLALAIAKTALIVFVAYLVLKKDFMTVLNLPDESVNSSVKWTFGIVYKLALNVVVLFAFVAALDWCFRKYKYEQSIMMTKEEVKDEMKDVEQNPLIKRAQMKKMRELSVLRMMTAIPKATVVITNPTHVAVAIEYDPETMDAPKVVAKGLRLMAQRIKRIARENNVPVVERPEVARALYKHVKVGNSIPSIFFEVVAEVLAYLHRIGKGIKIAV